MVLGSGKGRVVEWLGAVLVLCRYCELSALSMRVAAFLRAKNETKSKKLCSHALPRDDEGVRDR